MTKRKRAKRAGLTQNEEDQIKESMARLASAGLLGPTSLDPATGVTMFSLGPDVHRLLMAGRDPTREVGFLEAFATGDPSKVREWLAAAAAHLDPKLCADTGLPDS